MNNRSFQKAINFVFTLALAFGLLLPASSTLALPQKAAPRAVGNSTPNDTRYLTSEQWNLNGTNGINAPAAWTITNGLDVVVAVIDTGITTHDDLDGTRILSGYDFISVEASANDGADPGGIERDPDPRDEGDWCASPAADSSWPGTHVAGIIGARSNNGTGVAGINWVANILPVRVSGKCDSVSVTDLMDGMSWAAGLTVSGVPANSTPAKVINVGVGVPGEACTTHQTAINNILATGAVIVAAVGDNGAETINFPANCTGVISVAATDVDGNRANISNYGSTVKISAPGESVLSTVNSGDVNPVSDGGTYTNKAGTGIAAAHVSGVVSLMLSMNSGLTPTQILQTLQKTAKAFPGGSTCTTSICGSGIVDAGAALKPDLKITNVFLTARDSSNLCPYGASQPSPAYSPPPTTGFCVYITVKNQGGSNSGSGVYRNVYIDMDPSTLEIDLASSNGGLLTSNPADGDELDPGIYANDNNLSIPPGVEQTLPVPIPGLATGVHQVYAYTDANGNVAEVFEDNNDFAPVTIAVGAAGGDTIGVFRRSNATFYLRNSNTAGAPDITKKLGATTDYPVVGDWDGNGTDTIGLYRNGVFYLSNSNTTGQIDLTFAFGKAGDQPIAGDWNGDGIDTIGIYRSLKITFLLRNTNSAGAADATFKLGIPGDVGIAGDWNADGKDSTGVFRPSNGALYFKNANTTGYADIVTVYGIKNDKPVVGDWDSDGDATIGIYRSAQFYLRNTNTKGYADFHALFGANGDMPLSGNWDGSIP